MTDNSYMFVDEDKEDISAGGGKESKGKYLDESVTGKIEDESTINLVADEDVAKELTVPQMIKADEASSVALGSDKIETKGKGFGVASLVCGMISITLFCSIFNIFSSIMGLVFGIIQIKRGEAKGIAITGIICSVCSVILLIICMSLIMSNTAFVDMITSSMLNMGIFTLK